MIITTGRRAEQLCWSQPRTRFSGCTGSARVRSAKPPAAHTAAPAGLAAEPALAGYHHLPSVRGDLLARLGRNVEAVGEFRRAAALTRNGPERTVLLRRADDCEARS